LSLLLNAAITGKSSRKEENSGLVISEGSQANTVGFCIVSLFPFRKKNIKAGRMNKAQREGSKQVGVVWLSP